MDTMTVNAAPAAPATPATPAAPAAPAAPVDAKEAARRARVVSRRMAEGLALTSQERAARNASVTNSLEDLEGDERKAARKEYTREDKAKRRAAAVQAARDSRVSVAIPALDAKGRGETTVTLTYTDPTTGRETRGLFLVKFTLKDSVTLVGAGLAALDD